VNSGLVVALVFLSPILKVERVGGNDATLPTNRRQIPLQAHAGTARQTQKDLTSDVCLATRSRRAPTLAVMASSLRSSVAGRRTQREFVATGLAPRDLTVVPAKITPRLKCAE
jgi:hypothetical protein